MTGQIYKIHANAYYVYTKEDNLVKKYSARGLLKLKKQELVVGDFVEVNDNAITKVVERKNLFIRPSVANVDLMVCVLSCVPEPDLVLIDKLLVNAELSDIEKIIVVNKTELDGELFNKIKEQYKDANVEIFAVSAKENLGIDELKDKIRGKFCVFAGQSAVGKTSLVNTILNLELKTGEVSEKIGRGKHTTTYSQIYEGDGLKIIDSPGFAILDAFITLEDLRNCYPEFLHLQNDCKFRMCSHTSEPDCAIKKAVEENKISKERYSRYVVIYNELKEKGKLYGKY